MTDLTQKGATDLVRAMKKLAASLRSVGVEDAEETRLIEALETAIRWGYIAHIAEYGGEFVDSIRENGKPV